MNTKINKKSQIKKLYHITLGMTTILTPRIPENILKGEDDKTPRICVCPTIEDCFKSVSWAVNYYEKGRYEGKDRELVRVLEFDVQDIGLENIVDNDFIVKNSLVPDAIDTNEFWIINKTIKASSIYYIYPGSMDYAYLGDHTYLGIELYSYLKIDADAISEDTVRKFNGTLFPWELGIPEHKIKKINVQQFF